MDRNQVFTHKSSLSQKEKACHLPKVQLKLKWVHLMKQDGKIMKKVEVDTKAKVYFDSYKGKQ